MRPRDQYICLSSRSSCRRLIIRLPSEPLIDVELKVFNFNFNGYRLLLVDDVVSSSKYNLNIFDNFCSLLGATFGEGI